MSSFSIKQLPINVARKLFDDEKKAENTDVSSMTHTHTHTLSLSLFNDEENGEEKLEEKRKENFTDRMDNEKV